MTGILLAGGKSKRMGIDKAFLEYNHRKLFEYPLSILTALCDEIIISSSDLRFEITGHKLVPDKYPGQGPLAGIFTCLSMSYSQQSLVLSCDMPMMDPAFIHLLVQRSKDFPVTIGINRSGNPEPMAGIYHKSIVNLMESQLVKGKNKLQELLSIINVQYINPLHEGFDPDLIYLNINSPGDLFNIQSNRNKLEKNS